MYLDTKTGENATKHEMTAYRSKYDMEQAVHPKIRTSAANDEQGQLKEP